MGDAYDELDMMLEEPYRAKSGRYDRSPPPRGIKDGRKNATRGRSPSMSPPPARRPPPRRDSGSPPPPQRRGPPPPKARGRRSPSPMDDQWDRSPSPPPRRRMSKSPPPPKKAPARSPPRGSLSPPPRKGMNRSPSRSLSPPPKRPGMRRSPSASPPPPRGGYGSRSPPPQRGMFQNKRSPPAKGRQPMSRSPSPPPRQAPKHRSPSMSPPPRFASKGRSPSPPPAGARGGSSKGPGKAPPPRSLSRSPSPRPKRTTAGKSRSPSPPPPPRKAPSWNRSPSRSVSPPSKPARRNRSPMDISPPPPTKQRRSPSPSPPPPRPQQQSRDWSPRGGQQPKQSPPWKRSPSPPAAAASKKASRSPSPLKRSLSPQPKPPTEKSVSPVPIPEKKEKEKENDEDGKKRRKSRSKSPKSKKSKKSRSKSPGGSRKKSPSRKRSRSRSKERKDGRTRRSRSREKWGDRNLDRQRFGPRYGPGRWSPPKGGRRQTSPDRRWGRPGRSPPRRRDRSKERKPRSPSPARSPEPTPEERDLRTVLCMQLSPKMRERDLREFMSSVGLVRDVRVIADPRTKKCKGVAYVEFKAPESVALAIGLTGQKLLGIPIQVLPSGAEKNRAAQNTTIQGPVENGPMRIYVGSLHYNITEAMLRGIFEPFGAIDSINLLKDPDTGLSRGYGFLTFTKSDDAKRAIEQLNGFEIAGRPMKVANVTEKAGAETGGNEYNKLDDIDTKGVNMGASGRIQLMAKLAEGTGFQIPAGAAQVLNPSLPAPTPLMGNELDEAMMAAELARQAMASVETANTDTAAASASSAADASSSANPPINTTCFMLTNMFDPSSETNSDWESEIKDDVIDECTAHGGAVHVHVDKTAPQGNVYVKVLNPTTASLAVNALHGRMFAGRVITAAYIPEENYVDLFPDAKAVVTALKPSRG